MEENKNKTIKWKARIQNFIETKNFYVMIVLCIGIIVFSGLFITSRNIISSIEYENQDSADGEELSHKASNKIDVSGEIIEQKSKNVTITKEPKKVLQKKLTKNISKNITKKSIRTSKSLNIPIEKKNIQTSKKVAFEMPIKGKVIVEYSNTVPIFSKTLNEWRCHAAIDLAEEPGTAVKAVMDGIVAEVKNDPRFGYTVIVDHGDGLKSLYAAMVKSETVVPNQKIKTGEVLGIIGNTAPFEALEQAHLHFEVLKNGLNVDPNVYMPQLKDN